MLCLFMKKVTTVAFRSILLNVVWKGHDDDELDEVYGNGGLCIILIQTDKQTDRLHNIIIYMRFNHFWKNYNLDMKKMFAKKSIHFYCLFSM